MLAMLMAFSEAASSLASAASPLKRVAHSFHSFHLTISTSLISHLVASAERIMAAGTITGDRVNGLLDGQTGEWRGCPSPSVHPRVLLSLLRSALALGTVVRPSPTLNHPNAPPQSFDRDAASYCVLLWVQVRAL